MAKTKDESSSKDSKKEYTREEIQKVLSQGVDAKLAELAPEVNAPHVRRTIRAMVRIAAAYALKYGCPPEMFLAIAMEALVKEAPTPVPTSGGPVAQA